MSLKSMYVYICEYIYIYMEYMHTVTHTCAFGHIHAHTFCTWPGVLLMHYNMCATYGEHTNALSEKVMP